METLPTELITDILSRLPVKLLLCCKTVCKFWNNLINTPNFIKAHLNRAIISNSDRYLLRWSGYTSLYSAKFELNLHPNDFYFSKLNLPFETHKQISLVGSCNGIVCITDSSKNNIFSCDPLNDVFLYNPLTKSHRKLPASQIPNPENWRSVIYGFGYDRKNDDYKVLKICQKIKSAFLTIAMVYSLNNNRWRSVDLDEGIESHVLFDCDKGVLVNEALHYMVSDAKSDSNSFSESIYRFDFGTDSFSLMESPVGNYQTVGSYLYGHIELSDAKYALIGCFHKCFLREMGGCLYLLVNDEANKVDVWVMKEYGNKESWTKLFCLSGLLDWPYMMIRRGFFDPYITCTDPRGCEILGCLESVGCIEPIVYSEDKDGRRLFLVKICSSQFCWYDLDTKKLTFTTSHDEQPKPILDTRYFVGSLVSLY